MWLAMVAALPLLAAPAEAGAVAHTITGTVETIAAVRSPQLDNARDLLVYLPPGYATSGRRYPVAYLHDGQNVFDEATAFVHREWRADETAQALAARGREVILVAVDNVPDTDQAPGRLSEYSPFPDPEHQGRGLGDRYVAFLVDTVKPLIDARYRTLADREHTAIIGSSMGGHISLYAGLQRPDVFGLVGALSPSLWFADRALVTWIGAHPPARRLRVWLDSGTREGMTPEEAQEQVRDCREAAALLKRGGAKVRLVVAKGATHDEDAWAARLPALLEWFLGGTAGRPAR